jgi:oligopeptide/dipeptide ABC transporter ATP-binding protein
MQVARTSIAAPSQPGPGGAPEPILRVDAPQPIPPVDAPEPILRVEGLRMHLRTQQGIVKAVDDVSFDLYPGETLGLVGESGSGKSMTCLSILRLLPERVGRIVGGSVRFRGVDLVRLGEDEMRHYRGRRIAIILQDPMTSLNPVLKIGDQVAEPMRLHQGLRGQALWHEIVSVLRQMRIAAAETVSRGYPHQLSGGMRQRVGGAIAMAAQPDVLIADEPTTALDATIQAQYLALLKDVQQQAGLAIIFVTHDFGIVATMCDRVAVMYAGKLVELAGVRDLFDRPYHPYTEALLRSVPRLEEDIDRLYTIEGQPPTLHNLPPGCSFAPRCPRAAERCFKEEPPLWRGSERSARCWKLVADA